MYVGYGEGHSEHGIQLALASLQMDGLEVHCTVLGGCFRWRVVCFRFIFVLGTFSLGSKRQLLLQTKQFDERGPCGRGNFLTWVDG